MLPRALISKRFQVSVFLPEEDHDLTPRFPDLPPAEHLKPKPGKLPLGCPTGATFSSGVLEKAWILAAVLHKGD